MAVYPSAIPTTTDLPDLGAFLDDPDHIDVHNDLRDEIIAICAELGIAPKGSFATVKARLAAGWQPINAASFSAAASVNISIPASTYRMVRLFTWFTSSASNVTLRFQVNSDSTAALHRYLERGGNGSGTEVTTITTDTSWRIGRGEANEGCFADVVIGSTHTASQLPYKSTWGNYSGTAGNANSGVNVGSLAATRTLSSLLLFPGSGTITGNYIAEGYFV